MHSLQPQQNAQLRPRGHDENILEEAYRGRYARQRLLNFWPESSCGYHAIKRFVCIIQVLHRPSVFSGFNVSIAATITASMEFTGVIPQITVGDYGSLYSSTIEVINTTAGTINVSGTFYNENGTQSTVSYLTNISSVPSFTGTLK